MALGLLEAHGAVDLTQAVLAYCSLEDLGRAHCADRFLKACIARANGVWDGLCAATWQGKAHIAAAAVDLRAKGQARSALRCSLEDARRHWLTLEELTSFDWAFRFKAQAGPEWQSADPFWTTGEAASVRFEASGAVVRTTRTRGLRFAGDDAALRWTWGSKPSAGRTGQPHGSMVQVHVNGRCVPTYIVSRHAKNWGFVLQSCWVVYMSFPMPRRGEDPALDDEHLAIDAQSQAEEARLYNRAMASYDDGDVDVDDVDDIDDDDDDDDDTDLPAEP